MVLTNVSASLTPMMSEMGETISLESPPMAATSLATSPHLGPATRAEMSPPMALAAVMAWRVEGFSLAPSCSANTSVDCRRDEPSTDEDSLTEAWRVAENILKTVLVEFLGQIT